MVWSVARSPKRQQPMPGVCAEMSPKVALPSATSLSARRTRPHSPKGERHLKPWPTWPSSGSKNSLREFNSSASCTMTGTIPIFTFWLPTTIPSTGMRGFPGRNPRSKKCNRSSGSQPQPQKNFPSSLGVMSASRDERDRACHIPAQNLTRKSWRTQQTNN